VAALDPDDAAVMPRDPSLGKFVLRAFLWLLFNSGIVTAIEQPGSDLVFVTTLEVRPAAGQVAVLLPEVNPRLYTYGLALFLALMLATRAKAWKIALGAALLLPFQSWGIAFDFLMQVGIQLGREVSLQTGFSERQREAIALGYQAGNLIFPSLAPVAAWAFLSRHFLEDLSRARAPRAVPHSVAP
jgi:hypothetical protein